MYYWSSTVVYWCTGLTSGDRTVPHWCAGCSLLPLCSLTGLDWAAARPAAALQSARCTLYTH